MAIQSLLIYEPDCDGHRMQHVRRIAREAVRRSSAVTLLTLPGTLKHPAYLAMREELGGAVETAVVPDRHAERALVGPSLVQKQIAFYRHCRRYFQTLPSSGRPDVAFVPFLDHFDRAVATLGSPFSDAPWGGLIMNTKFHYRAMGARRPDGRLDRLKRRLFLRLFKARALRVIFTIDELLRDFVDEFHPTLSPRLCYVGDPIDLVGGGDRRAARGRLGLPAEGHVLLAYGSITARKGLDTMIAAASEPGFPEGVSFLLVGGQDAESRAMLAGPVARALRDQGRLVEVDRYVSDREEHDAFLAADSVWAGYRGFYGMSGVLVQAASMGLPVIATADGLIGWLTDKYELGRVVDVGRPGDVADAIARLVRDRAFAERCGRNGVRLSANHTSRAFAERILDALDSPTTRPVARAAESVPPR